MFIFIAAPLVEADKETDEQNYLLWRIENGVAEGSTEIPKGVYFLFDGIRWLFSICRPSMLQYNILLFSIYLVNFLKTFSVLMAIYCASVILLCPGVV